MTCSEAEPCPIYLELAHVYPLGRKLFVTGNIHSAQTTLYSILLASEDGGSTWREAFERLRGAELDKIQFTNFETGWISGQRVTPLPGDPFLLLTNDGGKTWRKQDVFSEGGTGSIQKMWFDSPRAGALLIDRGASDGEQMRYSRYETVTGGTSWTIRETAEKPLEIPGAPGADGEESWRIRGDAAAKLLVVEKRNGAAWSSVATIALELAQCKGEPAATPAPPPTFSEKAVSSGPGAESDKKEAIEEFRIGPAAPVKKKKQPK